MTPERLAKLIPLTLAKLSPPAIVSSPGNPIALCGWLNRCTAENSKSDAKSPLGTLWPEAPRIAANHYSLAQAPILPQLHTGDCGPVQFCNHPGVNSAGQYVPALARCQRVADHVIAHNGEVAFTRTDFTLPGPIPFNWQRHYRQGSSENSGLGYDWRHSLSEQLHIVESHSDGAATQTSIVELHTAEGRLLSFTLPAIGHSCYNRFERLLLHRQSLHSYRLSGFDQPDKIFRADGTSRALPLVEIRDKFGNSLTVDYQHGLPQKIVSSWGRVLDLVYRGQFVEKILNRHTAADNQTLCTYEYAAAAERLSAVCAGSVREDYRYGDQQITTIESSHSGAIEFSYDNRQRCYAIRRNQLTHKLSWRPAQQQCTLKLADRYPVHWKFSEFGQLMGEVQQDRATSYLYDHYGNLCQMTTAGLRNIYRYDEFGRLVRHTYDGAFDRYVYDERGLLIAAQIGGDQTWKFAYGERTLPEEVVDPSGCRWRLAYCERGQLTQLVDPENGRVEFHWDSEGQLTTVQRGDRRWTIEYDDWQRLTTWTCDSEVTQQWRYGNCGELLEHQWGEVRLQLDRDSAGRPCGITADGQTALSWQFDTSGNIGQLCFPDGPDWQIRYDAHDRIVQATTATNTLVWHYDVYGQLSEYADAHGDRINWRYDQNGRVREYRDNDAHWYFLYTDSGTLRQIRNNSGQQCQFHFDTSGRLVQAENGHSRVRFQYDRRNLLIAEHHDSADHDSLSINHQYDCRGWLKRSTSENLDLSYLLSPDAGLYGVDANGEAALRCEYLGSEEYWTQGRIRSCLQHSQGRLSGIETAHKLHWQFAPQALLADVAPAPAPVTASRDPQRDMRGNVVREQRADRPNREYLYQYDGWGLMTSAENGDFKSFFRYDPFGRRLSKSSTHRKSTRQRRIDYRWYSLGLWCERSFVDDTVLPVIHYLYHPLKGTLLSKWQADTLEHYLVDPAGAPLALFDHQGELLWPDNTDVALDANNGPRGSDSGPWHSAGKMMDSETGLCYGWRGYWHPLLKCWLHKGDPLSGNHHPTLSSAETAVAIDAGEPA